MNYNDQILENKAFNFFKQLMYNIALSLCIMLVGVLIMVYGFKIGLYEVLSDSQAPYFVKGDMVVVKPQDDYYVGDIIKFQTNLAVTHRLIAIKEEAGKTYYLCHGDNVQSANPSKGSNTADWQDDAKYIEGLIDKPLDEIKKNIQNVQIIQKHQIEGKVVAHIDNYGTYFKFIKDHSLLIIALVAGIWCVSTTIQNEIDIKQSRRLV